MSHINGVDPRQWLPLEPVATCSESCRKLEHLVTVLNQFDVLNAKRYQATIDKDGNLRTFCNIFVSDATDALGCGIPHWVDHQGYPSSVGKGGELTANGTIRWLENSGPARGWEMVSHDQAHQHALGGRPVVACWYNSAGGSGHVAMVLPGPNIAQAGKTNMFDAPIAKGFGTKPVVFWSHP